jgi:voltage-gated potassium channel
VTGQSQLRRLIGTVLLIAAATAVYFLIPVPGRMHEASWVTMFSLSVIVLGLLIMLSARRLLRAGEQARIRGLVLLLTVTVLFFSWADESVAALPNQFAELTNKTDAMYFNISTLATVGFGDVHPVGQLARAAVTLQIVFNLVFLGTAVSLISGFFRRRAAQGRATASSGAGPSNASSAGPANPPDPSSAP